MRRFVRAHQHIWNERKSSRILEHAAQVVTPRFAQYFALMNVQEFNSGTNLAGVRAVGGLTYNKSTNCQNSLLALKWDAFKLTSSCHMFGSPISAHEDCKEK